MIPQTLTIQGLYSYQDSVHIDFRRLTAAQLFGIFGPVGSGKSSILEAMTLALYGESARLNKGDKRSTNMLNLRSDRLYVDFVFLDRRSRRFRFTAEAKRNRKRPEEVGVMSRRAFRFEGPADAEPDPDAAAAHRSGEWVPLDHVDGERVLGLSYRNFRRTTIIPQGKFQEFLQLGATERTEMMKELFQLERFDLHSRTRSLLSATSTRLEGVESALRELPEDPETIQRELRAQQERLSAERATAGIRLTELQAQAVEYERILALLRELEELRRHETELRSAEHSLTELEAHIGRLRAVRDYLRAPLDRLQEARRRRDEAEARIAEVTEHQEPAQQRLHEIEVRRRRLDDEAARRPVLEALRDALRLAGQRAAADAELQELERARDAARARRDDAHHRIAEFHAVITELEAGIPDRGRLRELHTALHAEQYYRAAVDSIAERRRRALQAAGVAHELHEGASPADELDRMLHQEEQERRRLQADLHRAAVDDQLRTLADSLVDGEPCPVCGSVHHPGATHASSPPDAPPMHEALRTVEARVSELTQLHGALAGLADEEQALQPPPQAIGEDELPSDLRAAAEWLEEVEARYATIDARRTTLEDLQTARAEADAAVLAEESRIEDRRLRREQLAEEESTVLERLDEDARERFRSALESEAGGAGAAAEADQISQELTRIQKERETIAEEFATAAQAVERLTAQAEERRHVLATAAEELQTAESAFTTARADAPVIRPDAAEADIAALVSELPALAGYEERLATARDRARRNRERITELTGQLAAIASDTPADSATLETELTRVRSEITHLEQTITALGEKLGAIASQLETAEAQIVRRTQLIAERDAQQARRDNLTTLLNLFRGAGFVSYVAQVYLEQLVAAANHRFRSLTRNQLELVLSGDRDFAVIDHLNGGRRRSVKTLSGGQTFQAALCLALALVDSIDHDAGGDQPAFFFLDEGFGSLDGESLRDVFETLKNLRREHRIIGIISHVEALQQEIDTSLVIHLDEDRGSVVAER